MFSPVLPSHRPVLCDDTKPLLPRYLIFIYSLLSLKEKKCFWDHAVCVSRPKLLHCLTDFIQIRQEMDVILTSISNKSQHIGESTDLWCVSDIWLCPEIMQDNLSSKNKQLFYGTFCVYKATEQPCDTLVSERRHKVQRSTRQIQI